MWSSSCYLTTALGKQLEVVELELRPKAWKLLSSSSHPIAKEVIRIDRGTLTKAVIASRVQTLAKVAFRLT